MHSHQGGGVKDLVLLRKAFRRLTPRCIQQKFSTKSIACGKLEPNLSSSACLCCSTNLLNSFCESDDEETISVQFSLSAFGMLKTWATSLSICSSREISSIIQFALPSDTSLTENTIPLMVTPPSFFVIL